MTLREFTRLHLSNDTDTKPVWKKAFPPVIRRHTKKVGDSYWKGEIYKEVLEEKFIRLHRGDVIDVEWRDLPHVDDTPLEY